MFDYIKKTENELTHVVSLLEREGAHEETLLKGTIRKKGNKSNATYGIERVTYENGIRHATWTNLGEATNKETLAVAEARFSKKFKEKLEHNKLLLIEIIKNYLPYDRDSVLEELSENVREIIETNRLCSEQQTNADAQDDYSRSDIDFKIKHISITGETVRSKNEVIIYNLLTTYGIPFRYEEKLVLKNEDGSRIAVCPDFVIRCNNGDTVIYEHLGMLNDIRYRKNFMDKMGLYEINGYTLWDNLIITADGTDGSINTEVIDMIIRTFIIPKV